MNAYEKLSLARANTKLTAEEIINKLCSEFFYCSGDRLSADDKTVIGGFGRLDKYAVTMIGINRTKDETAAAFRYGMPMPSGYRKAYRLMQQAEKFNRPIITLIDTPGAFPGIDAEKTTQAIAIAENIALMSQLKVPIISIILGEGGSGGALALGVCDKLYMLENSIYSIISPEACATILWKDKSRASDAAEALKFTPNDLHQFGICDEIIPEEVPFRVDYLKVKLLADLKALKRLDSKVLIRERYQKYREVGRDVISG